MTDVSPFSGLFHPFPLTSEVFDLHGTIGPNNCDTVGISQLKIVKLCTRTDRDLQFYFLAVHQTISESGYRMKD